MHSAKIERDASGVPTGLTAVTPETLLGGAIKSVTNAFDKDSVLVAGNAIEAVAIVAVPTVLGAVVQKKVETGEIGIPFISRKG